MPSEMKPEATPQNQPISTSAKVQIFPMGAKLE